MNKRRVFIDFLHKLITILSFI